MGEHRFRSTTTVCVRELSLLADIGVNADEIGRRQPLIISVLLRLREGEVESLEQTVDYRCIAGAAEALSRIHIPLIETFAQRLCLECLGWQGVEQANVSIDKPFALERGLAGVAVTLARFDAAP